MFKQPNKPESAAPVHSLLGKDTLWKGEVHSGSQPLRIEGTVEGTVLSEGDVTVAPTGVVTGTVKAKHLIVTGKVRGVLDIAECLEIHGTGWVEGEITAGALVVDEGGTLQGTCIRRGLAAENGKPKADAKTLPATGPNNAAPAAVGGGKDKKG